MVTMGWIQKSERNFQVVGEAFQSRKRRGRREGCSGRRNMPTFTCTLGSTSGFYFKMTLTVFRAGLTVWGALGFHSELWSLGLPKPWKVWGTGIKRSRAKVWVAFWIILDTYFSPWIWYCVYIVTCQGPLYSWSLKAMFRSYNLQ